MLSGQFREALLTQTGQFGKLYQFVGPAPPREITMATGEKDGYYHELGTYLEDSLQREVVGYLMEENGLLDTGDERVLLETGGQKTVELLETGSIDDAFFTMSPPGKTIQSLIGIPENDFLDIRRSEAHTARYPFLASVSITERTVISSALLAVLGRFTGRSTDFFVVPLLAIIIPMLTNSMSSRRISSMGGADWYQSAEYRLYAARFRGVSEVPGNPKANTRIAVFAFRGNSGRRARLVG